MADQQIDHDMRFKELISTFFMEFLELFLPEIAKTIEPDSVTFLQQEYFVDLQEGERKVIDLLAEVKQSGQDTAFLFHLEPQSTSEANFQRRLFFYFSILHQRHLKRIFPIAIFSYDQPYEAASTNYNVEFSGFKVLDFNFMAIQLNQMDWRNYLNRPNPVAAALMAKMKIAKRDRPKVKAECLRLLVTLKLDPAKSHLISRFVDTYLRLNDPEEQTFQAELDKLEVSQKEDIMETLTSWEEKGMEKERQTIALNMLRKKLPVETIAEVTGLTPKQVQVLQTQMN
jgi:predicted transposase YdaD